MGILICLEQRKKASWDPGDPIHYQKKVRISMRVEYRPVGSRVLDGFIEYIRVLRDLAEPPKAGTEAENAGDIKELRPGCSEPADFTALPWLKGAQPCWPRKPCPCQRGPRSQQLGQHQEWRSCSQFSLLFLHL